MGCDLESTPISKETNGTNIIGTAAPHLAAAQISGFLLVGQSSLAARCPGDSTEENHKCQLGYQVDADNSNMFWVVEIKEHDCSRADAFLRKMFTPKD